MFGKEFRSSYYTLFADLECVNEVRFCQIGVPNKNMNPFETCIRTRKVFLCLKQLSVKLNCIAEKDKKLVESLTKVYKNIYKEEGCMKSIECVEIGIQCWNLELNKIENPINGFPVDFDYLIDIYGVNKYFPQLSQSITDDVQIQRWVCW